MISRETTEQMFVLTCWCCHEPFETTTINSRGGRSKASLEQTTKMDIETCHNKLHKGVSRNMVIRKLLPSHSPESLAPTHRSENVFDFEVATESKNETRRKYLRLCVEWAVRCREWDQSRRLRHAASPSRQRRALHSVRRSARSP